MKVDNVYERVQGTVELITIVMSEVVVHSVYKPPKPVCAPSTRPQRFATYSNQLPKSFSSARWKKGYNPDLIFASGSIVNMGKKSIIDPIPHTQHRSIGVSAHPVMVPQTIPFR